MITKFKIFENNTDWSDIDSYLRYIRYDFDLDGTCNGINNINPFLLSSNDKKVALEIVFAFNN